MPRAEFNMIGDIAAFDKIDNVYTALKREGAKLLTNWELTVKAEFTETQEGIKAKQ